MGEIKLPIVEVECNTLGRGFTATFKEMAAGHLWYVGRDLMGWSWILDRLPVSERDRVVSTLDTGIARFRHNARSDVDMIAAALSTEGGLVPADKYSLLAAVHRLNLALRAIYELQDNRAAIPATLALTIKANTSNEYRPGTTAERPIWRCLLGRHLWGEPRTSPANRPYRACERCGKTNRRLGW